MRNDKLQTQETASESLPSVKTARIVNAATDIVVASGDNDWWSQTPSNNDVEGSLAFSPSANNPLQATIILPTMCWRRA